MHIHHLIFFIQPTVIKQQRTNNIINIISNKQ